MKEKIGVFLSRMQPLHIGHIGIIKKALEENDKVLILIGSKNKEKTLRNPLNITLRREILEETIKELNLDREKIIISELADWSMETDYSSNLEWGRYLYYNIVSLCEQKSFSIYFSDEKEIIEAWFDENLRKRINLRLFERQEMFEAVSSTKIREAFLNDDKEYIEKNCPSSVIKRYNQIKEELKEIYENPKQDYKMEE